MGKKTKLGKTRLDKFYHLAKEQGYRSRAAFKLIQLNRKYDFLSGARTLLDLCAAPGGWCQVAVKNMPVGSTILGVDLAPIKAIRGVKTFIGDITTQKCRQQIIKESSGALMDVVLCDGAPNVGGAWASEAYSQVWLALEALKLATDVLAPKGTFVTKVFRSKDYTAFLYALNQLFDKVEATKPAASRNTSAEIFVVCRGYKAPSKIDPRLLDARHLFGDVTEMPKTAGPDALLKAKVKQRRFREGYEEGLSTTHKSVAASVFVKTDSPVEMLGRYTVIDFVKNTEDEDDQDGTVTAFILDHPATTDEIRVLCKDLQVLGRSEFKQLLKWRLTVRRDMDKQLGATKAKEAAAKGGKTKGDDSDDDQPEDPEERLLREMSEIRDRLERRKKREKKRRRELKVKSRLRAAQLAEAEGIADEDGPEGLFSLKELKGGRTAKVAEADAPSDDDFSSSDSDGGGERSSDESDIDSDEERRRYDATMDEYLEESYRSWKERQRIRETGGNVRKKRRRLGMDGELSSDEEKDNKDSEEESGSSSEDELSEEDEGDLIVSLDDDDEYGGGGRKPNKAAKDAVAAAQWFSQDVFGDADVEEDTEDDEDDGKAAATAAAIKKKKKELESNKNKAAVVENGSDKASKKKKKAVSSDSEDDVVPVGKKAQRQALLASKGRAVKAGPADKSNGADGFEVVPVEEHHSGSDSDDSSEDEFEALNDDAKAEVLALAKKMLRRRDKTDLMEAAYNRYAFHDEGLPKWFNEDERKFMRPAPQITTEEYKQAKEELRAIDARPIKKVAEAKARKRKRLGMKLQAARSKAEAIANEEYVPAKAKMREIEKVYAKARASVNGKKGGKGKKGGRDDKRGGRFANKGPPLDARLRSDKRGMEKAAKRMKGKGKGGKGKGRR